MRAMVNKFKERKFMQNVVIEVVADLLMLIMGIVIGYYFKTMLF